MELAAEISSIQKRVTLCHRSARLLSRFKHDISEHVEDWLKSHGVKIQHREEDIAEYEVTSAH